MRIKIISVLLLAAILMLTGCTPQAAPAATPAAQAAAGLTVTDSTGRSVSLARPPQRIVLAGRAVVMVADAVYTFPEASSRIVATSRTNQGPYNFIEVIDASYNQKTILELDASPEQVAASKPDLVIMKSTMAERLGKPLEKLGFAVVYLDFETPDQYQKDITTLGKIFQNEARARQVAGYFQNRVDQVSQAISDLKEEQKPRLLLLQYTETDGQAAFNVPPASWMQTLMAQMAGGRPVWKDANPGSGWAKVNLEQIAAWDADQVYIISYTTQASEVVNRLKADPRWQGLRATRSGKLYAFPSDFYSWDQPDTRWILGLTWLAAKVNPEKFASYDVQKEARSFYKEMYGMDDAIFQAKIQLLLKGDLR